jgi:hypothetical protein
VLRRVIRNPVRELLEHGPGRALGLDSPLFLRIRRGNIFVLLLHDVS